VVQAADSESDQGRDQLSLSLAAIPASQQFRPPRRTPRPFVQGPQTAVVVGPSGEEIFTDKYGRVKVQFHWDR
jgi:type VI secretion system secreted protein VgrG